MSENLDNVQVLPADIVSGGKAWRRFFARIFDLNITISLFILLSGHADYLVGVPSAVYAFCVLIAWMLIEPIWLATLGTTPGKLLLGIKIRDQNNQKLSIIAGFKRSCSVWFYGFGVGILLISLFTLVSAYSDLTKRGATRWDRLGHIRVSYEKLSILKVTILFLIVLLVIFLFS